MASDWLQKQERRIRDAGGKWLRFTSKGHRQWKLGDTILTLPSDHDNSEGGNLRGNVESQIDRAIRKHGNIRAEQKEPGQRPSDVNILPVEEGPTSGLVFPPQALSDEMKEKVAAALAAVEARPTKEEQTVEGQQTLTEERPKRQRRTLPRSSGKFIWQLPCPTCQETGFKTRHSFYSHLRYHKRHPDEPVVPPRRDQVVVPSETSPLGSMLRSLADRLVEQMLEAVGKVTERNEHLERENEQLREFQGKFTSLFEQQNSRVEQVSVSIPVRERILSVRTKPPHKRVGVKCNYCKSREHVTQDCAKYRKYLKGLRKGRRADGTRSR